MPTWDDLCGKSDTAEQLLAEADAEDRKAKNLRGCSFAGDPPWRAHEEKAALLRQAALEVQIARLK